MFLYFSKNKDVYGKAGFIKGMERRKLLSSKHTGLYIADKKHIPENLSFTHLALIAPTGSGKTTRYIIPNILRIKDGNSIVVTDPSKEVYRYTAGYLHSLGYDIKVFNVSNAENSFHYNPIAYIENTSDIFKISDMLIDTASGSDVSKDGDFWNDSAKLAIALFIRLLLKLDKQHHNLKGLSNLLHDFSGRMDNFHALAKECFKRDEINEYMSFCNQDTKVLSGILSTAKTAMRLISDPNIAKLTSDENLLFPTLRMRKSVLYIQVPEPEMNYYSFITSILYTQIFSYCLKEESSQIKIPIYFFLDEFATQKYQNFMSIVNTIRKKKCSISIALQTCEQLSAIYGKDYASGILNGGMQNRLFLSGMSLDSCKFVEELLGMETIKVNESGYSKDKGFLFSSNEPTRDKYMGKPLMTADEIRRMKSNNGIFVSSNYKPAFLKTKGFYEDAELLKRSRMGI